MILLLTVGLLTGLSVVVLVVLALVLVTLTIFTVAALISSQKAIRCSYEGNLKYRYSFGVGISYHTSSIID